MTNLANSTLLSKVEGCLYGGAIGDALGAPAEWHYPPEIRKRYGYITDFVENWDGPSAIGKGDGRYTDDTHMVQLLGQAYLEENDHLDAYSFAKRIVPKIAFEPRWVPEKGREMLLIERLFYPEKWLYNRLHLSNENPRTGGIGNMVNCGAAMYAAPVGMINAGDPLGAYREAIDIFSAHQHSYGLEAAGVLAACVAEAMRPGADVDSIVGIALSLAKDGTQRALAAVVEAAQQMDDWREAIAPLRDVIRPFDGSAELGQSRGNGTNNWRPSREHSIEELPIALAFIVLTKGDFEASIFGAANYGRDNDSIAGMAGGITGALHGGDVIRSAWKSQVDTANRVELSLLASDLAGLAFELQQRQYRRAQARQDAMQTMVSGD
jgi:ADP-ribosylglycohydrolase